MTTTQRYDVLNRLNSITNTPSDAAPVGFRYVYNAANQRTTVTNADTSRWVYTYDKLGQVISGKKYWSDNTRVAGQQFEYAFDDIGNRRTNGFGGDSSGAGLRPASYAVNNLNQYTSRTVPGYVNVLGDATNTASVSVNTNLAYRKDRYFRAELAVNNTANPVSLGITNAAVLAVDASNYVASLQTGHAFVRKTPETFTYDADGNLLSDGRWNYTWDAENRLVKVESRSDTPQGSWRRVEWRYDALGRRNPQTTSDGSSGNWVVTEDLRFVRNPLLFGRHIAELRASDNALVRSYVWGLDLSGTMGGAGGVGGLLWVTLHTASGSAAGTHFCAYDGNGNVVALVSASDGSPTARYEYAPFGEPIRLTGPAAALNPFRFSSKRTDASTDLVLYEYRLYSPTLGRWPSRDPINEPGFQLLTRRVQPFNLQEENDVYHFALNDSINKYDPDGRVVPAAPVVIIIAGSVAIEYGVRIYCVCAFKRGQEAYLRTPTAILAHFSAVITATIQTYCDGPGTVRLHLWKDQNGDCHDELVVICTGKKSGA